MQSGASFAPAPGAPVPRTGSAAELNFLLFTAQFAATRRAFDPLNAVSMLFKFQNGLSGVLGAVRATPIYRRVHVFGAAASIQ